MIRGTQNLFYYKEWLYFTADSGNNKGRELWKTDEIPHRTFMVADICQDLCSSEPRDFIIYKEHLSTFRLTQQIMEESYGKLTAKKLPAVLL